MPSLQEWLQDVVNMWPVIWANKATLIPILVGIVVFEWLILRFWYSGQLASKDAEIKLQDRQLADYRGRIEPRQLTAEQRKILIERARGYVHHKLTITYEGPCPDCATYAMAFEATLREAGWVVHNWHIEIPPQRPRTGIAVLVPDLNNLSKEAESLRTALVAADVDIDLMHLGDFAVQGPLQLLITARAS
jgi:hypothetical protein